MKDSDSEKRKRRFIEFADGGIGLIITGALKSFQLTNPVWKESVEAIHAHGGKVAVEIIPDNGFYFKPGTDNLAVSKLADDSVYFMANNITDHIEHREAGEAEISNLICSYGKAAAAAQQIGADAVEIHSAHQSVAMQFLSPVTNKRTDKWGGSLENRTRFHREICEAVRKAVGKDFPVIIKLGLEDMVEGGIKFEEGKLAAKLVLNAGYDAIEVSQGIMDLRDFNKTPMRYGNKVSDEAYFRGWSREIKKITDKPVILQGGIKTFSIAEEIIKAGDADFIGMCRPFACEPGLVRRWKNGDQGKAKCTSCNKCLNEMIKGYPWACVLPRMAPGLK